MRIVRAMVMVAAAAAVLVAMAACSGGKSSADKTKAAMNPAAAELEALLNKFQASSFRAQYNLSGTGDEALNGQLTLLKGSDQRVRFDVSTTQDGQPVGLTLLQTKDQSLFCLQDAGELAPILGVDPGSGVCFKNDPASGVDSLLDLTGTIDDLTGDQADTAPNGTRTIAGIQGRCFTHMTEAGDSGDTCFSDDGVLLYDKSTTGGDTTTIEATSVQGTVQDADFNVPYVVKDLPDFGGGD